MDLIGSYGEYVSAGIAVGCVGSMTCRVAGSVVAEFKF
jgi:hypothetical protein